MGKSESSQTVCYNYGQCVKTVTDLSVPKQLVTNIVPNTSMVNNSTSINQKTSQSQGKRSINQNTGVPKVNVFESDPVSKGQSWGFTSRSTARVILGQVLRIATCGTRTHRGDSL